MIEHLVNSSKIEAKIYNWFIGVEITILACLFSNGRFSFTEYGVQFWIRHQHCKVQTLESNLLFILLQSIRHCLAINSFNFLLSFLQTFSGNTDSATVVKHEVNTFAARYVRFRPQAWNGRIALRVEIFGCLTGKRDTTQICKDHTSITKCIYQYCSVFVEIRLSRVLRCLFVMCCTPLASLCCLMLYCNILYLLRLNNQFDELN